MKQVLLVFLSILAVGCFGRRVTSPEPVDINQQWSPCIGVHTPGGVPFTVQMDAIRSLWAAQRIEWVRMDTFLDGRGLQYHKEISELGIQIINIVRTHELEAAGWWTAFDRIAAIYPGNVWQIGNEIQNGVINNGASMGPDEYMAKLWPLSVYAAEKGYNLVSASPEGIPGQRGPDTLRRFLELGLLDLDISVGVNVYSEAARNEYGAILFEASRDERWNDRRVFVTETGIDDQRYHIRYVQEYYPGIHSVIQPDLICWYTLYAGEGRGGLLDGILYPPIRRSPLLSLLVNG